MDHLSIKEGGQYLYLGLNHCYTEAKIGLLQLSLWPNPYIFVTKATELKLYFFKSP